MFTLASHSLQLGMSVFALAFYQPRANLQDGDKMSDEYLGKPCSLCGKRITGANWLCKHCGICICFGCGERLEKYITCPKCGNKLS